MAITVIHEKEPAPGTLGRPELYALAVGQCIGAGVITLIVPAIHMTGYSAWLAFAAAVLMGFFMVAPHMFISSTVRMSGGPYSMLCGMASPRVAGIFAYMYIFQCISLSMFGTSAAAYIGDIIPLLGTPTGRMIVGIVLLTFFYVVNLFGINAMAKLQKKITWILIICLLIFAAAGILHIKLPIFNFSDPDFLTNGWEITFTDGKISGGFTAAVLLLVYSCQGYFMTTGYGASAKNARRDIPFVMLVSVPTILIVYVGVAIAGVGALSLADYGKSTTLVFAAKKFFPTIMFYFFIIGGPIMALLTTLNASFAYNAITIGKSCDDGWLPAIIGKENKHGARIVILTFMWIMSLLPVIFRFSITTITNMTQLLTSTFAILYFIAEMRFPKLYPKAWKQSRFHVPNVVYYIFVFLSLACYSILIWKSIFSMNTSLIFINLAVIVILVITGILVSKTANVTIKTSLWAETGENMPKEE